MSPLTQVTLATLAEGAAVEQVNYLLEKAWENVMDPNTDPEADRKVTLTITIKPTEKRDAAAVEFQVTSKLPGPKGVASLVYRAENAEGKPCALTRDIRQHELLPEDQPPEGVRPIGRGQQMAGRS